MRWSAATVATLALAIAACSSDSGDTVPSVSDVGASSSSDPVDEGLDDASTTDAPADPTTTAATTLPSTTAPATTTPPATTTTTSPATTPPSFTATTLTPAPRQPPPSIAPAPPGGSALDHNSSLVRAAVADLAERLGIAPSAVTIVDARAVTWSDRSLGCPEPGVQYLQVLVDGAYVQLRADGADYAYHGGSPLELCANSPVEVIQGDE